MKRLSCLKVFGKDVVESHSEFNLALALAKCCRDWGYCLDMSGMVVNENNVSEESLMQFRYLIKEGYIYLEGAEISGRVEPGFPDVDVTFYKDIPLYNYQGDLALWSFTWAVNNYGEKAVNFSYYNKRGFIVLSVVAYYILKRVFGNERSRKLVVSMDFTEAKNTYYYLNVFSCCQSLEWLNEIVELDIDMSDMKGVDLDYQVFCSNSYLSKKYNFYTVSEKRNFMKQEGLNVGSILILWERGGICANNRFGNIESSTVVRLDEIGDNYIGVTEIHVNKTKEDVEDEYFEMDEEMRDLYSDILSKPPLVTPSTIGLENLGVEGYFYTERFLITKLDRREKVVKTISGNGEKWRREISGIDAIYWLLCQYDIEFDKSLYKSMYSEGEDLLWDIYGTV